MALETGLTYTSNLKVQEQHLAVNAGSGDLRVLATPMMMALMENAAMMAVAAELEDGQSTVGGQITSSHIKPTGLGHNVSATAELVKIEGRKLFFRISASDEDGIIGEGEHLRFIINKDKFMSKITEAAVCVLDKWPDEHLMMNIAAENNLSETAFIVKEEEN